MVKDTALATTDGLPAVVAIIELVFLFHCNGDFVHDGVSGVTTAYTMATSHATSRTLSLRVNGTVV